MIQPLQASRRLRLSVAVAAGLACSAAIAAEEGDIATLMATMSCENCDLSHADLSGLDLTDARYESATVRDALLCNTTDHRGDVFNRDC